MKRLLMVGAGSCQINAIQRIKALGIEVVVADYHVNSAGKAQADYALLADTFDEEAILEGARHYQVDGLLTVGTDQPVYVVNSVAEKLKLPQFITRETAFWVTNKKAMKQRFDTFSLPTTPYVCLAENFEAAQLLGLESPYVLKPLDSQGQRGIYKVMTLSEIQRCFPEVLKHSRQCEILVESYYKNDEITVSGWVTGGDVQVFTISDRVTFPPDEKLGVCLAHNHPSKHSAQYGEAIIAVTHKICKTFHIDEGPIYFQMFVGASGLRINEIACRLGGAYEDITIPYATDVDVLGLNIYGSLGQMRNAWPQSYLPIEKRPVKPYSTQLFFCHPGKIDAMTPIEDILSWPFVIGAAYNYQVGDVIGKLENASQRAGYFIVTGRTSEEVKRHVLMVFNALYVLDPSGHNLVYAPHIIG